VLEVSWNHEAFGMSLEVVQECQRGVPLEKLEAPQVLQLEVQAGR